MKGYHTHMKWYAVPVFLAVSALALAQTAQSKGTVIAPSWYITDTGIKVLDDDGKDGILLADGMWCATSSIRDKQLIAPIAVKIECGKSAATCREIDATIAFGILHPDMTEYAISIWNTQRIVAEDSNEGPCKITHRLIMDFKSKTVTLTDLPSQADTKECKMYRDANSYILHGGQVMLFPSASYDPLAQK
jgi:hypothetical protein